MNIEPLLGNFLALLNLAPTLLYALLPLKGCLRYPLRRTMMIAAPCLLAIMVAFTLLGAATSIPLKWLFALALAPTLALYFLLVETEIDKTLFCFFNATMIAGNGLFYGMMLAAPLEVSGTYTTMRPISSLICLGVTLVLGAIYYKTLAQKIPYLIESDSLKSDYRLALGVTVAVTALFFWVMPNYVDVVLTGRTRITVLVFMLLAPLTFLLVYHSMWGVAVNITENAQLRESNDLMALGQKRYEELRAYMDETRNLRHDFRQHLLVLDEYAKAGETEKLSDYIGQFTESLAEHRSVIAANPALDAVAAHYATLADNQDTRMEWRVELPQELPLKESDLITVFGNLVENALIAVRDLPAEQRVVSVHAKMLSEAMLGLTVTNPYEGTIKMARDGLPIARKSGHGVGLSSVQAVAKRYNGSMEIDTADNVFTAGVLLFT